MEMTIAKAWCVTCEQFMESHDMELQIGVIGVWTFNINGSDNRVIISILPLSKKNPMLSNKEIPKLKEKLHQAWANKARWDAEVKAEVEWKVMEEKRIAEEKVAAEGKRVVKEQAAAEAEMQPRVSAMLKAEVMAVETWQITKAKVVWVVVLEVEAKCKAEAEAERWVKGMELEQGSGSRLKQKGWVEGKQVTCIHCMAWGFWCKVSWIFVFLHFC